VKLKVLIVAVVSALVLASTASAGYQVIFGAAKRAISREAAGICAEARGCKSWSVKPCARRSFHRVDCRANFFFPESGYCTMVMIGVLPPYANEVIVHHKRISC
jgi:hypothetical protein